MCCDLPELASKNGKAVDALMVYVHWLMLALFVGWIIYFFYALWRFRQSRNPKADYHGVRNHASSYIELAVAAIEAVLLVGIAVPLWAKAVDKFPTPVTPRSSKSWRSNLPGTSAIPAPTACFGRQDMKFVTSDNVFGVDPTDPARQGRHSDAQRHPRARQQAGHHLCQFQGRDSFAADRGHARLSGRDSRPADSRLVHAHENRQLSDQLRPALRSAATPA